MARIKHRGMRPQDVVVVLKMLSYQSDNWTLEGMAESLMLSKSEVHNALERNKIAGLVNQNKKQVNKLALRDFLINGIKYVFPPQVGLGTRGIPTAHSAAPINQRIAEGRENYVWAYYKGTRTGNSIVPLYENIPKFIQGDTPLYEYLVIVDTFRVGKQREIEIAIEELDKKLNLYAGN